MCDLNFYGTLSTHRKSEKHQQLKTFLHPRCFPCLKEFPSRIEYDEHCLTPSHMKNAVQCEEQRKNKKKGRKREIKRRIDLVSNFNSKGNLIKKYVFREISKRGS
jgi:hypothetical protein